jgi:hypothetical protein
MNLSKDLSVDKELFYGVQKKENTDNLYKIKLFYIKIKKMIYF